MKSSRESPVEFLEPLSRYPDRVYAASVKTPFGPLALAGDGRALIVVRMNVLLEAFVHDLRSRWGGSVSVDRGPFEDVLREFDAYFSGVRRSVRAVVRPLPTTPFTLTVHRRLAGIPYGTTITYAGLAEESGNPRAARAAGSACGRNPVLVVVPCHRVVAANGLGGFGAGLDLKKRLLSLESGA